MLSVRNSHYQMKEVRGENPCCGIGGMDMELMHGVNLGGWMSQCVYEEDHYDTFISKQDIAQIAKSGFDHVRLPVDYPVLEEEDGTYRKSGFDRLYKVIDWCMEYKLNIILDLHRTYGYDFNDAGDKEKNSLFNNQDAKDRFVNLWIEIAKHFFGYKNIAFELLNEVVEEDCIDEWNALIHRTVGEIRKIAPLTPIIYGGVQWNSARTMQYLGAPIDENIIYTFHFYEPLIFTHQKAYWVKNMDPEADVHYPAKKADYIEQCIALGDQGIPLVQNPREKVDIDWLEEVMSDAITTADRYGVQLYCGEYGVIDRAPLEDTLNWFRDTTSLFRKYKIGSAVWSWKEMDFGLTEPHYDDLRDEIIREITR